MRDCEWGGVGVSVDGRVCDVQYGRTHDLFGLEGLCLR